MAPRTVRGEVWIVDLGMVAKIRSCLVLIIPNDDDNDRVLTTLIPHTTSTHQSRFEVVIQTPFLKDGAFDTQNIITIPSVKLIRRLGALNAGELAKVELGVKQWFGLDGKSDES